MFDQPLQVLGRTGNFDSTPRLSSTFSTVGGDKCGAYPLGAANRAGYTVRRHCRRRRNSWSRALRSALMMLVPTYKPKTIRAAHKPTMTRVPNTMFVSLMPARVMPDVAKAGERQRHYQHHNQRGEF